MSNYNAIRAIVKQFSGQDNIVTVPKVFVKLTGDFTSAILLNQIVFYSDKSKRNDGFFYKTYKEWEEEVCMSERQVRYGSKKLKEAGYLETKVMKANGAPTVHYKLDYDKLLDSILTKCQIPNEQNVSLDTDKTSETLTEITTEITTENTTIPYVEIVTYLNNVASKNYRPSTSKTKKIIKERWGEGFRLEDFKRVIDIKTKEWINDEKMDKFLRPDTLFGTKFEGYLNQKEVANARNNRSSSETTSKSLSDIANERSRRTVQQSVVDEADMPL